ncbi:MAG: phosphate signaling complex protein PhoU [Hyphomicrobiaceae bacterium]
MNSEHIVKSFDNDLNTIESLIVEMGGLVETQISNAISALIRRDQALGMKVLESDARVDELESTVDAAVIRILVLRQPKAQDLRSVIAVLKVAGNLERIGDYAKNIAKRAGVLGETPSIESSSNVLRSMGRLVQEMLKDVLDAYVARDIATADQVRVRDHDVDQMHNTLFRELLTYMMEDPRSITPCMHLLFIAKNLERMGDHTTGIAEQVHYIIAGSVPDDERPKQDITSVTMLENDIANGSGSNGL